MHSANPALTHPSATAPAPARAARANGFKVTPLPSVPDPHGFAGAFAGIHQAHLIAGGGANFPDGVMPWDGGQKVWHDHLFSLDLHHPEIGWKPAGKLPAPNAYGVSLTVADGVVIIGGGDRFGHLAEVHLLTLDENQQVVFRPLPSLPEPLAQMSGAVIGRNIHICGGISSPCASSASNRHWVLDFDHPTDGWSEAAPLPAAGRILATAAAVGHQFIIAGGCSLAPDSSGKTARSYLRDAWKFEKQQWSRIADLPRPAVAAASPAPVSGESFFIISGDDGEQSGLSSPTMHKGFNSEVLRCEVRENRWTSVGNLTIPAPVMLPTAPWKNGCILFNGEIKPGVRTPQVVHFAPDPSYPRI